MSVSVNVRALQSRFEVLRDTNIPACGDSTASRRDPLEAVPPWGRWRSVCARLCLSGCCGVLVWGWIVASLGLYFERRRAPLARAAPCVHSRLCRCVRTAGAAVLLAVASAMDVWTDVSSNFGFILPRAGLSIVASDNLSTPLLMPPSGPGAVLIGGRTNSDIFVDTYLMQYRTLTRCGRPRRCVLRRVSCGHDRAVALPSAAAGVPSAWASPCYTAVLLSFFWRSVPVKDLQWGTSVPARVQCGGAAERRVLCLWRERRQRQRARDGVQVRRRHQLGGCRQATVAAEESTCCVCSQGAGVVIVVDVLRLWHMIVVVVCCCGRRRHRSCNRRRCADPRRGV